MALVANIELMRLVTWCAEHDKSCILEYPNVTTVLIGVANSTASTAATVWTVFKVTVDGTGQITSIVRAIGVAWDNRGVAAYV